MLRPTAIKVVPQKDYQLQIAFDNDEIRVFDMKPYIRGSWFGELADEEVFQTVFVNGITVEWPGGQDICPDELYYKSRRKEGA